MKSAAELHQDVVQHGAQVTMAVEAVLAVLQVVVVAQFVVVGGGGVVVAPSLLLPQT